MTKGNPLPGLTGITDGGGPVVLIGCDPGPSSSAYLALQIDPENEKARVLDARYTANGDPDNCRMFDHVFGMFAPNIVFAYETCSNYGRIVGASVFSTAAMGGEIRGWYRGRAAVYGVPSPDWRRALTGFQNANDSLVRSCLEEYFHPTGGGKDRYKGVKNQPGPWAAVAEAGAKKPGEPKGGSNVKHILDAMGVAIGLYKMRVTTGRDYEMFRIY